jgi:uncharacterized protein involved in exopolysaccharide biosynthesis
MSSQSSGVGTDLSSLSGLSGITGISGIVNGMKSSEELHIALMRSHSVQSSLIEQFNLKERYGSRTIEEARLGLSNSVNILADKKSGILFIDAQDKDPVFAAQLANAHVVELNVILRRLSVTETQQKRSYYERQILTTQAIIPKIESEFKEVQKRAGVEVSSLLSEIGTLPGQIATKELQRELLSQFATSQNPDMKKLALEISALRSQLSRYEDRQIALKTKEHINSGKAFENTPNNFVQKAIQLYNTLKIQDALLDGYVKQLELTKIEEGRESYAVQVVDVASPAEMRDKPQRKKMVIAYTVTGFIAAFVLAILRALIRNIQSTPEGVQRWMQLKRAWGLA